MTKPQHTQSEWHYDDSIGSIYAEVNGRFVRLADLPSPDGEGYDDMPESEYEANACLMATAPELLEALTLAQTALNTAQRFHVPGLPGALNDSYKIAAVIDKAIAKATGK